MIQYTRNENKNEKLIKKILCGGFSLSSIKVVDVMHWICTAYINTYSTLRRNWNGLQWCGVREIQKIKKHLSCRPNYWCRNCRNSKTAAIQRKNYVSSMAYNLMIQLKPLFMIVFVMCRYTIQFRHGPFKWTIERKFRDIQTLVDIIEFSQQADSSGIQAP